MPRKVHFAEREDDYARLWRTVELRPDKKPQIDWHVNQIMKNRARYKRVENITNIPWWFVGLIHAMEASYRFDKHLHNGDSLRAKTRRVPAGRIPGLSPPYSWEVSAEDALRMKGFHKYTTWKLPEVAFRLELFNGWGYYLYRGIESPYLWSYTNHYSSGKYVADGKYSRSAVSKQAGALAILKRLSELSPPIKATLAGEPEDFTQPETPAPEVPEPNVIEIDPDPQPKAERERPTSREMKTSRKFTLMGWLKWVAGALGFGTFSANFATSSGVNEVVHYGRAIQTMFAEWGLFGVTVICLILAVIAVTVQEWMKDDVEEERYEPSGGAS